MKVHNCLPLLLDCLTRWEEVPSPEVFEREYARPMRQWAGGFFDDFHEVLADLDWPSYRAEALRLSSDGEERRLRGHLADIERLFGFSLEGEALLVGAFTAMDGFARFERGSHRVFLGVDESHGRGKYIDVLMTHELTHVARESRPEVWTGWGLDPKMTRREFLNSVQTIEHLMNEGFSCVVSELLVPGEPPWAYAYQTEASMSQVMAGAGGLDRRIHRELRKGDAGDYGPLYAGDLYDPPMPDYAHYVWAWQWVKRLLRERAGGDARKLVGLCSRELVEDALEFELAGVKLE